MNRFILIIQKSSFVGQYGECFFCVLIWDDCSKKCAIKNKQIFRFCYKSSSDFSVCILALEIIDSVSNDSRNSLISTVGQFFTDIYWCPFPVHFSAERLILENLGLNYLIWLLLTTYDDWALEIWLIQVKMCCM